MEPVIVKDWQKDCVYLIQFPRAGCIPSVSPYCLKLETWLRMVNIPYQNVDNQFKFKSRKGQIPFVELNGRQIPDTNYIITELTRVYGVDIDDQLDERQTADFCAYHALIEDSLAWSCAYFRSHNLGFLASDDGIINHFSGFRKFVFRTYVLFSLKRSYRIKCRAQGIGKHSPDEVMQMTKKNLKALSIFLGNKRYLMGDQLCTLDATAFGHLSMFYYAPLNKDIRNFIESDCRNLADYLRNLRDEIWPDWNEACSKLSLATKPRQGMLLSTVESLTRPKQASTPLPPEPNPESHRRNSIEVFDVDEITRE